MTTELASRVLGGTRASEKIHAVLVTCAFEYESGESLVSPRRTAVIFGGVGHLMERGVSPCQGKIASPGGNALRTSRFAALCGTSRGGKGESYPTVMGLCFSACNRIPRRWNVGVRYYLRNYGKDITKRGVIWVSQTSPDPVQTFIYYGLLHVKTDTWAFRSEERR